MATSVFTPVSSTLPPLKFVAMEPTLVPAPTCNWSPLPLLPSSW